MADGYCLVQDQDCHWYVIPSARRAEWYEWSEKDDDDPESWNVPGWADPVGGSPELVTFSNYETG